MPKIFPQAIIFNQLFELRYYFENYFVNCVKI